MRKPKSDNSLVTYDILLPGALVKRTSEAMGSAGLARLDRKAVEFLAMLVRRSISQKARRKWVGPIKPRFVRVSATRARKSFNDAVDYKKMVDALLDARVIEQGRNYSVGQRCREYRPAVEFVNSPPVIHTITGRQAVGIVRRANEARSQKPLRCPMPVFEHQLATLRRLCISPDAQAMLDRETISAEKRGRVMDVRHQRALNRLGRMKSSEALPDRLLIKEDQNGRMYSPVVNLTKCFRQYLTLDGEPLVGLDITSCQPFLLAVLLNRLVNHLDTAQWAGSIEYLHDESKAMMTRLGATEEASRLFWAYLKKRYTRWSLEESVRTKAELSGFKDLVCSGKLYEVIMATTDYKGNRASFKAKFFHALYSRFRRGVKTQEWRCFARMFPRIAREIKLMKYYRLDPDWRAASKSCKPNKLLPCILQAIEARYMFNGVCPALIAANIEFITIHDCVLVKASKSEAALAIEKAAFARWGLNPAINVETLETSKVPKSRPLEFSQKNVHVHRKKSQKNVNVQGADEPILSWEDEELGWA